MVLAMALTMMQTTATVGLQKLDSAPGCKLERCFATMHGCIDAPDDGNDYECGA